MAIRKDGGHWHWTTLEALGWLSLDSVTHVRTGPFAQLRILILAFPLRTLPQRSGWRRLYLKIWLGSSSMCRNCVDTIHSISLRKDPPMIWIRWADTLNIITTHLSDLRSNFLHSLVEMSLILTFPKVHIASQPALKLPPVKILMLWWFECEIFLRGSLFYLPQLFDPHIFYLFYLALNSAHFFALTITLSHVSFSLRSGHVICNKFAWPITLRSIYEAEL